ncbi:unnamed protein product [Absidia cylindrospora]
MTTTYPHAPIPLQYIIYKNIETQSSQLQQCNSARGRRFSQKLVDAARKSSVARYPLLTPPSTSNSLSPPPGIFLDDDGLTDTSSCLSTPQRNEYELNRNLRNLALSPFRLDSTIISSPMYPSNDALYNDTSMMNDTRKTRLEKRTETQQHIYDSPSLSAKPKRRKLKQQRTISWRMAADATLDTSTIHGPSEPNCQQNDTPQDGQDRHQQKQPYRRSSRIATQRIRMRNNAKLSGSSKVSKKKPPITLGIPSTTDGRPNKSSDFGSVQQQWHDVDSSNGDDDDYDGDTHSSVGGGSSSTYSSSSSSGSSNQRRHRQRQRSDIVEERLDKLMYAYDTLDLRQYSIIPRKALPPVYIELDDDDDDNYTNSMEKNTKYVDLTTPSPSSSSSLPTTSTPHQQSAESNGTLVTVETNDDGNKSRTPTPTSTNNTVHDDGAHDERPPPPPASDNRKMDSITVNRAPLSTSPPPQKRNSIDTPTTTTQKITASSNDETSPSANCNKQYDNKLILPTMIEKTVDHLPSQKARDMYTFLTSSEEQPANDRGPMSLAAQDEVDGNGLITSDTTTTTSSSSTNNTSSPNTPCTTSTANTTTTTTTTADQLSSDESSLLNKMFGSVSQYLLGN